MLNNGLPIDATKNRGLVDIIEVNFRLASMVSHLTVNSLLTHMTKKGIENALLKLLANNNLDVEDIPLKFSLDGDFKINGELDVTRQKELIESLTHLASFNSNYNCYDSNGDCTERLTTIIKNMTKDVRSMVDIVEYAMCSYRRYSYRVKPGAKITLLIELMAYTKRLQMRGFLCCLVHMLIPSSLNVVPLFALRAQALRHLLVKWGIELSKMVVLVWERGDTNYEDLLVGLLNAIILRDLFQMLDMIPQDNPSITFVEEGYEAQDIFATLLALGIK
ncbi:hypothetical protein PVL29_002388 [Vitis rotundifolia]|uniref:Sucrose phosphatase-like domain-containing protein n=1 Tax=Vitis rotundifolia TaxID=103349 RepID=A0AA39E801_VITRO|nr:hypothetical protein PVL29_002388 [Vitis rotundifolia]